MVLNFKARVGDGSPDLMRTPARGADGSPSMSRKKKAPNEAASPRRRLTVTSADAPTPDEASAMHLSAEQRAWIQSAVDHERPRTLTHGGLPSPGKKEVSNTPKKSLTFGTDLDPDAGIAFECRKGLKPEAPNQDDYVVVLTPDYQLYGVFDGHGPHGHHVANMVARQLPALVAQHPRFPDELATVLPEVFVETQERIKEITSEGRFNAASSGSTGSVVVVRDRWLWCAWVGDSRVALGRGKTWEAMVGEDVSWDHKPELPDEKARIEAHGGAVRKYPHDVPHRVCSATSAYPGLAMSRSFGDLFAGTLGVSHEPSMNSLELTSDVQVLILCSDGIWEFLSTEEVTDVVRDFGRDNLDGAVEKLCQLSWDLWIEEEGNVVDDLTALIVDMQRQRTFQACLRA